MISIVTAYYNRKKLFYRTLQSIKRQNCPFLLEIIAVDDGSEEKERIEDLVKEFPFLKVIRLSPKKKWYQNSCIPFNIGIKEAKSDKIILQNPECLHIGNILETTENNLTSKNYLSFACFSLDKPTTENLDNLIETRQILHHIRDNDYSINYKTQIGWLNHSVHRPESLHFCTAITSKNINKLGGFDEIYALGIAYDDNEILWRIINSKLKIQYFDNEIVLHQNHYSPDSSSFENRKNKERLLYKNERLYKDYTLHLKNFNANFDSNLVPYSYRKHFIHFKIKTFYLKKRLGLV